MLLGKFNSRKEGLEYVADLVAINIGIKSKYIINNLISPNKQFCEPHHIVYYFDYLTKEGVKHAEVVYKNTANDCTKCNKCSFSPFLGTPQCGRSRRDIFDIYNLCCFYETD